MSASVILTWSFIVAATVSVSGDCPFPSSYTNRFWFLMYTTSNMTQWTYRQFNSDSVVDNRNDNNSLFRQSNPCNSLNSNQNAYFYLTSSNLCSKSVITSNESAILTQQIYSGSNVTNSSQCEALFTESCLSTDGRCSAQWMPKVNQLTVPPPFDGSINCPFQGVFQLSASYSSTYNECSSEPMSTVTVTGPTMQMNLCTQGTLRTTQFKTKTVLQDSVTCMAQLPGESLNSEEAGLNILLLQDSNVLYCARYSIDSSANNIQMSINVKSSALSAYCGASYGMAIAPNVLLLNLVRTTITTGGPVVNSLSFGTTLPLSSTLLPTPTTATSTTLPTPVVSMNPTPIPTSTSTSTSTTSTSTSTTTTSSSTSTTTRTTFPTVTNPTATNSSATISSTTIPSATNPISTNPSVPSNNPMISSSTTFNSQGSPGDVDGASDNCPYISCGNGANCDTMTHRCRCPTIFYRYSNGSNCIQDDRTIDDTFLKIVIPIIVISGVGSLIAALVLFFATSPINATVAQSTGAALAAASQVARPAAAVATEPAMQLSGPTYTYAGIDAVDRNLVTYGGQPPAPSPQVQNNFVMVNSTIPPKM